MMQYQDAAVPAQVFSVEAQQDAHPYIFCPYSHSHERQANTQHHAGSRFQIKQNIVNPWENCH